MKRIDLNNILPSDVVRLHGRWKNMVGRCHHRNHKDYPKYGAKGIRVCDRWRKSFDAFVADMGFPPDGLSIDRINGKGHYEPGNCRWASIDVQAMNRSHVNKIAFNGETLSAHGWCKRFGLPGYSVGRVIAEGGDVIEYLTRASQGKVRRHRTEKKKAEIIQMRRSGKTLIQIAERVGCCATAVSAALQRWKEAA